MSDAATKLIAAALALPEEERVAVRDAIEASLTGEADDALFAELERRRAEHESGRDPGIPADELFRQLREKRAC